MRTATFALLACLCPLLPACSGPSSSSFFAPRNGPEFAVAFPDATELVTTSNVPKVRKLLATVPLPETDEHHEMLEQLLANTEELDAEHLLLLTEAVARDNDAARQTFFFCSTDGGERQTWSRGGGGYSNVIDKLLFAGVRKVRNPSPHALGRLLSRTQCKESLVALVSECASREDATRWDDGSTSDLKEILEPLMVDELRLELCVDALLPLGRLDEERAEVAVRTLSFDEGRTELIRADYARRDRLSPNVLLGHVRLMSFDEGRVETVRLAEPLLSRIDCSQLLPVVQAASFDEARIAIVEQLAPHSDVRDPNDALELIRTASFDQGRTEILNALARGSFAELGGEALVAFVQTASFDSGREQILATLRPHARSPLSAGELRRLLQTASFDEGRQRIVEIFADDLRRLPTEDRRSILEVFSFSSTKEQVRDTLDW